MLPIADAARAAFPCVTSTRRRPPTCGSAGRSTSTSTALDRAVFAPDGEFLALYEPRESAARAVAVFV